MAAHIRGLGNHAPLRSRVPPLRVAFIRSAALGAFELFELERAHLARVEVLMGKYRALPMDLADASLVILAEDSGSGEILSTDARDFGAYRWKSRKPFKNLLLP
jgi:uncharacterized protein